jgi:hypothetical protein
MATTSVPRDQIQDGSLPSICVVCGADAPHRLFPSVGAPSMAWVFLSPIVGLVGFWASVLHDKSSSTGGGLPFCDRHRRYWPRRGWFIVVGFALAVAMIIIAAVLAPPDVPGRKQEPHWAFGLIGCWILVFLPTFLILHLTATRPTGGNAKSVTLSHVNRDFKTAVEDEDRLEPKRVEE